MINRKDVLLYKILFVVRIVAHLISPNMIKISLKGSVYSKTVVLFKSFRIKHTYRIPSHFRTHSGTDLASRAFIKTDLDWRYRNFIFIFCYRFNTVHRAKWYTGLTTGTVVFINNGHQFRSLCFLSWDVRQLRYPL